MTGETWAIVTVSRLAGDENASEGRFVVGGTVERVVDGRFVTGSAVTGRSSGMSSPGPRAGVTTHSATFEGGGEVVLIFRVSLVPVAFPAEGRIVATANGIAGETNAAAKSTMQVMTPQVIRVLRAYSSCI